MACGIVNLVPARAATVTPQGRDCLPPAQITHCGSGRDWLRSRPNSHMDLQVVSLVLIVVVLTVLYCSCLSDCRALPCYLPGSDGMCTRECLLIEMEVTSDRTTAFGSEIYSSLHSPTSLDLIIHQLLNLHTNNNTPPLLSTTSTNYQYDWLRKFLLLLRQLLLLRCWLLQLLYVDIRLQSIKDVNILWSRY
jgi:hypothetical protein